NMYKAAGNADRYVNFIQRSGNSYYVREARYGGYMTDVGGNVSWNPGNNDANQVWTFEAVGSGSTPPTPGIEKATFPMKHLRISQGPNDPFSHSGSLAMDFVGIDDGRDIVYAPFKAVVKRIRSSENKFSGEVYI
ncbi:RICIN domain-containing protein, partial [Ruminococcaceae bacterium OttesenSCG-928-N02]|nr:RICIN domain-containing protein [Ruminococcaceae bacterium OttesenSCG-928-N02]